MVQKQNNRRKSQWSWREIVQREQKTKKRKWKQKPETKWLLEKAKDLTFMLSESQKKI